MLCGGGGAGDWPWCIRGVRAETGRKSLPGSRDSVCKDLEGTDGLSTWRQAIIRLSPSLAQCRGIVGEKMRKQVCRHSGKVPESQNEEFNLVGVGGAINLFEQENDIDGRLKKILIVTVCGLHWRRRTLAIRMGDKRPLQAWEWEGPAVGQSTEGPCRIKMKRTWWSF